MANDNVLLMDIPARLPHQLPTDAMCNVLSFVQMEDRMRVMKTCNHWFMDVREMCRRQERIAFRFHYLPLRSWNEMHSSCCQPEQHAVAKNEVLGMPVCTAVMASDSCKASFMQLFPRLKVFSAPNATIAWDLITCYQEALTCLNIDSVSWCRTDPAVFHHLTCLSIRDLDSIRFSRKAFPNLISLRTESTIDDSQAIDLLPAKLKRLHCHLNSMNKLARLPVAQNLTHLRLTMRLTRATGHVRAGQLFSFPSLTFLCIHDENEWVDSPSFLVTVLAQHFRAPQLKSLCISGPRSCYEPADLRVLLQQLPPLHSLCIDYYHNPKSVVDYLIESQSAVQIMYFPLSSDGTDLESQKEREAYNKLRQLGSLKVYGNRMARLFSFNDKTLVRFLKHPLAEALQEIEIVNGIPLSNDVYDYASLPDAVSHEIDRLKGNPHFKGLAIQSGTLADAFMERVTKKKKEVYSLI